MQKFLMRLCFVDILSAASPQCYACDSGLRRRIHNRPVADSDRWEGYAGTTHLARPTMAAYVGTADRCRGAASSNGEASGTMSPTLASLTANADAIGSPKAYRRALAGRTIRLPHRRKWEDAHCGPGASSSVSAPHPLSGTSSLPKMVPASKTRSTTWSFVPPSCSSLRATHTIL